MFFLFAEGLFGGPLFDRFGAKVCSFQPLEEHSLTRIGFYQVRWPPAAAYVLSVMIISICVSYYQFVLTQGVLGGLATSMASLAVDTSDTIADTPIRIRYCSILRYYHRTPYTRLPVSTNLVIKD